MYQHMTERGLSPRTIRYAHVVLKCAMQQAKPLAGVVSANDARSSKVNSLLPYGCNKLKCRSLVNRDDAGTTLDRSP
jgi:hypothetical protein